ncbi:hypothetical protein SS1G_04127 [Sclerotinia sclerotiorum 1980 UF-70]|uniref:Ketoreductase domain-containing protein n=1 Tax=Sclerotinia sclerotiorum (strain ATCC 18683 / 1980 / Ss-1) TaxID=665079 RepID=A7EFN6_SCLS1|nr:hypothetical protein SS1G_04127 [Sclerotinia sclerotiorum 1980 UF-70]EDO01652.1 hypothetical protein SS1G_04127 [Sclerotinia sclerotiorum 1980 UF-70]
MQLQASYSTFSAIRIADFGCMFIILGTDVNTKEQFVTLSASNTHFSCPWENVSVPVILISGSEATFVMLVAFHLLVSSTIKSLAKGNSIVVFEPNPTFAAILSKEAARKNLNVVFITSGIVPSDSSWLEIQYATPEQAIRRLLPNRVSIYLDFSTGFKSRSVGQRIRSQLPLHSKYENVDTMFGRDSWTPLGFEVDDICSQLQDAAVHAKDTLIESNIEAKFQLPAIISSDIIGPDSILAPLSIVRWVIESEFSVRVQPVDSLPLFSESKTYWLAGLSGGLGLSLCEWMAHHGAKHIVISSRAPNIQNSWLEMMNTAGVTIKLFSCDNTNKDEVTNLDAFICSNLPPIAGIAQGAMVLQDTALSDMTFDVLSKVTRPKVEGSIHLNNLFQEDTLDFFVFFSSFSAVVGSPGQANYSAGNLFMTSLAEQRRRRGLAGSVINIGPILGVGYIAQQKIAAKAIDARSCEYIPLSERDFHQLLAEAVKSGRPNSGREIDITAGARMVSHQDKEQPGWALNPIMSHYVLNDEPGATEIRSWFIKTFEVNIPVLQILSGAAVGELISIATDKISSSLVLNMQAEISSVAIQDASEFQMIDSVVKRVHNDEDSAATHSPAVSIFEDQLSSASSANSPRVDSSIEPSNFDIPEPTLLKSVRLSLSQEMFWFVFSLLQDKTSLNHSASFRLNGDLHIEDLKLAVYAIGRQHETIRTCFFEDNNKPMQGIMKSSNLHLEQRHISDLGDVELIRDQLHNYVFDLKRGDTIRIQLLSFLPTIQAVCRRYRVTAFHFYLAVFRALLSRYTDAEDVSIGIGDANRLEKETMGSIGMFLNLLPLRFRTSTSSHFSMILEETRSKVYTALANSRAPFQVLLNELNAPRSSAYTPIFQCFVNYRQGQKEKTLWAGCELEMLSFCASRSAYDLALDIIDNADGETLLMFSGRKDLYDGYAMQTLMGSYRELVKSFAYDPEVLLSQPSLFKAVEIDKAMKFGRGPAHTSAWPETIVHRIDDLTMLNPQDPAVSFENGAAITYSSLLDHSNSIAVALQSANVTAGDIVATLQEPTAAWIASILGILRIGAVYLPLDLSMSWDRSVTIVQDCRPTIVLVDNDTEEHWYKLCRPEIGIINAQKLELGKPHVDISASSDNAAMILYTSGSTAEASESLLNWDKETALPPSLKKLAVSDIQIAQPTESDKVIVLTGASGFLGQALLASLDSDTRVKNIHCIAVRKAISQESIPRFAKAVIHQGDLNLPRLGLSEHSAQAIFSCATVVIHNGADVSYLKGYSSLRIANLQSTKELAALCLPRLIPFHYVSTAGVAMFATGALGPDNQFATASAAFYPPPLNLSLSESGHNYIAMTASKWASEQFLERMVMEKFPAWPICIHRPSLIERKDESGAGLDIVSNLRYYTQQLHAAPVINIGISVRGILQAALDEPNIEGFSSASKTRFLHHLGDVSLPLGDIRSWVAQDGDRGTAVMIEELPIDEWTRKAGECGMNKMVITLLESLIGGTDVVFPEYD